MQVGAVERQASGASPAFNRIDLLSVLMHELGHLLGKADLADASSHSLMLSALPVGTRSLPEPCMPISIVTQDINRDGVVSPLNALLIINQLNHRVGQSTLVPWSELASDNDWLDSLATDVMASRNHLRRSIAIGRKN